MDTLKTALSVDSITAIITGIIFFIMLYGISKLPKKKFSFAVRVLLGGAAGCIFGIITWYMKESLPGFDASFTPWVQLVADGFLVLFKMLLAVAIFVAAVRFITRTPLEDTKDPNKKLRKKTATIMLFISAFTGLLAATLLGAGNMPGEFGKIGAGNLTALNYLCELIPASWVLDLAAIKIPATLVIAWFIAVAARRMAVKKSAELKPFFDLTESLFIILTSVCKTVIAWKPMGAAAITAVFILTEGPSVLLKFVWLVAVLFMGVCIMFVIQLVVITINGVNPVYFIKESAGLIKYAAVTHSGAGCVEPAMKLLVEKFSVTEEVAKEVVPYSMTSAMQGCAAMFPSVMFVFVVQMSGMSLGIVDMIFAALLITYVSFGITGLPGTATMAEFAIVLGMPLGLSLHNLGPAVVLDPVADIIRTPLNVTGVMTNAICVQHNKK